MKKDQIITLITKYLNDKGNYRDSDMAMLDQIPYIMEMIERAKDEIDNDGLIVAKQNGEAVKNPAITVHALYLNKLREYYVCLGVTPKERRKLELEINDIQDDFDDE